MLLKFLVEKRREFLNILVDDEFFYKSKFVADQNDSTDNERGLC
jgi:hypothetical protein